MLFLEPIKISSILSKPKINISALHKREKREVFILCTLKTSGILSLEEPVSYPRQAELDRKDLLSL
jgi:hypothetical protein